MIYLSKSIPKPSKGIKNLDPKTTQPNQAMGLQEILERFTRGEKLNIANEPQYHESNDDLEKVARMDLVDKEEFSNTLNQVKQKHAAQEKRKAAAAAKKAHEEAVVKAAAELSKTQGGGGQPPPAK